MIRPISFLFTLTLVAACGGEDRHIPAPDPTPTTKLRHDEDGLLQSCFASHCAEEGGACSNGCQALNACLDACADDACSDGCFDRSDRSSLEQLHAAVMCASDCGVMLGQSEATDRNTNLAACMGDRCSDQVRHCFDDQSCADLYRDLVACGSIQSCQETSSNRATAEARSRMDEFLACYDRACAR